MYPPAIHDEITGYAEYIDQQLEALRASAHGLTQEQARLTPTRSALSIGGIIKHTSHVIAPPEEKQGRVDDDGKVSQAAFEAFMSSFVLGEDETLAETIAVFDRRRTAYVEWARSVDPAEQITAPPAPWYGRMTSTSTTQRFSLAHVIEELARHAGHADIIREQIDGATALELLLADTGREATPFAQPWRAPEPVGP